MERGDLNNGFERKSNTVTVNTKIEDNSKYQNNEYEVKNSNEDNGLTSKGFGLMRVKHFEEFDTNDSEREKRKTLFTGNSSTENSDLVQKESFEKSASQNLSMDFMTNKKPSKIQSKAKQEVKICYECQECGRYFSRMSDLNHHQRTDHNGIKTFECQECSECFSKKADLDRHLRIVHMVKSFVCQECGKDFSRNTDLNRHQRTVHDGTKPFKCQECGKCFAEKNTLKKHQGAVHSGIKPFECQQCGKSFIEKCRLNAHIKMVHTVKSFECSRCSKSYKDNATLQKHEQTVHDKIKLFACQVCGKCFAQGSYLKKHEEKCMMK